MNRRNFGGSGSAGSGSGNGARFYVAAGSTPGDLVSGEEFLGDDGSGNLARVGTYDENTGTVKELLVPAGGGGTVLGARATATAAQAISATDIIALNNELRDDGGFHDNVTNNSRMTVPSGGDGWYLVKAQVGFDTTTGTRRVEILKNGATLLARARVITGQGEVETSSLVYLVATDYVQMQTVVSAGMNTAVNADWSPMLAIVKVA